MYIDSYLKEFGSMCVTFTKTRTYGFIRRITSLTVPVIASYFRCPLGWRV